MLGSQFGFNMEIKCKNSDAHRTQEKSQQTEEPSNITREHSCICVMSFSFQIMMQKHNRHMSFSLYISVLAITDTIALVIGKSLVLSNNRYSHCAKTHTICLMY